MPPTTAMLNSSPVRLLKQRLSGTLSWGGIRQENQTKAPVDFDNDTPATITSHGPGYIAKELEKVVVLQTDKPLKRAILPNGGIRMVEQSCEIYGKDLVPEVSEIFTKYRKTHNQGVFDVYTKGIRACRSSGILTGLPDAYGRGRIIGDYRRVALYGIDFLMKDKVREHTALEDKISEPESTKELEDVIRLREEISEQYPALEDLKKMAASYGFDISGPATTAQEAIQWTYFGYLAAVKSQNGAAMSIGRVSSFFDIFITRDMESFKITETEA